jgi:hypothetical protein
VVQILRLVPAGRGVGHLMIEGRLHLAEGAWVRGQNASGVRKQRMFGVLGSRT